MPDSPPSPVPRDVARVRGLSSIDEAAESWVQRLQAGLSIEEEVEFADWLEADARHEPAFRKYQLAWDRFAPLAQAMRSSSRPEPGQDPRHSWGAPAEPAGAPQADNRVRGRTFVRWVAPACGLAAAIMFAMFLALHGPTSPPEAPVRLPGLCEQLALADGSVVELNRGAHVTVAFTEAERRVRLERGEASFTVASNPDRPFIVSAGTVEVRAVGTAFNVRCDPRAIEVVVTEGQVHLGDRSEQKPVAAMPAGTPASPRAPPAGGMLLSVGQSAVVNLTPSAPPPQVAILTPAEIESRLAWQPKLLDFDDAPLAAIVAEFNRRNPIRLIVRDPAVANRRMTASFRSDNLEAFVRLLESNIGVHARRRGDAEIELVRK